LVEIGAILQFINVECNTCHSKSHRQLFSKDGYNVVECNDCHLIFVNPRKKDVLAIYDETYYKDGGYYQNYIKNGDNYVWAFRKRMNVIAKFLKPGASILDVGCAYGFFLEVAKEKGFDVAGVEANEYMCGNVKRRLNVPCFLNTDLNHFPDSKRYDCITFFDSIEHLEHPREAIAAAWKMLNPGGILVITTPNIGSWLARLMGKLWPHVTPEEHIYYYTPQTMRDVLKRTGYEVLHLSGASYRFKLSEFIPKFKPISKLIYQLTSLLERQFPSFFQKSISLNLGDLFVIAKKQDRPVELGQA
jgi:2-polyprenyl-3-methyl-5-hydroxy-6-metoxy-1,4-benzoquinol methylase